MGLPRLGLALVRGRSMLPTLREGDRLLLRYGVLPEVGRLGVVRLPDGVIAVKRLDLHDADGFWFGRDNPAEGLDSWTFGRPSAADDVLGVVLARLWPTPRPLRGRPPAPGRPRA